MPPRYLGGILSFLEGNSMAESIKSKIARCEHTADTFEKVRKEYLKMARNGEGDWYYQYAKNALRRIETCRSIAARLRNKV